MIGKWHCTFKKFINLWYECTIITVLQVASWSWRDSAKHSIKAAKTTFSDTFPKKSSPTSCRPSHQERLFTIPSLCQNSMQWNLVDTIFTGVGNQNSVKHIAPMGICREEKKNILKYTLSRIVSRRFHCNECQDSSGVCIE